jgi:hypothetical protein
VKLVHFYTGKPLKNFVNVDKLRRLRDESREVLYNRHKPTQQTFITEDMMTEERTVQPSSDTIADGAPNSLNPIDTIVKPGNKTPVSQSLERGQNEKDKPVDATRNGRITEINGEKCPGDQPYNTQALSSERWSDQMAIGQQANRRDLLPSNTVGTKQLLVCRLTRPGGHNDAETRRIEARALESAPTNKTVTLQQMSGGHNKITAESGSIEDRA